MVVPLLVSLSTLRGGVRPTRLQSAVLNWPVSGSVSVVKVRSVPVLLTVKRLLLRWIHCVSLALACQYKMYLFLNASDTICI